ncbi:MAG: ABC transporter permease [Sinomicrobium sp.]|nr:ABC transporter permease [Sinomicrobium sp.]
MTSKLKLIIIREYLAKVRNRSFIVMTVLSPILIVGMIALIVFLTQVNSDEKKSIALLNESSFFSGDFETGESIIYIPYNDISLEQAKDSAQRTGYYGLLYIPSGANVEAIAPNIKLFTRSAPGLGVLEKLEQKVAYRIREERLRQYGVAPQNIDRLTVNYDMPIASFSGEENLKGINEMKAAIGGGFGYLIMMFIIIYGAFVMRSVIEEKTSRIIEVIISSVKPFQLMLGKIIGTSLAGITQFIIWIISAIALSLVVFSVMGVDMAAFDGTANLPPETMDAINTASASPGKLQLYFNEMLKIPWGVLLLSFVIYFILGYLIYSSIYAAIGASVDNETDTQQFMLPVILPLMLAIYVGFFSVFDNPHGPIAVAFSLFPLTSPIVMLMRLSFGIGPEGVHWWQYITSLALLAITFLGIVWLAAKIYRVGILMYGKKPTYKELYKWLKY